MPLLTAFVGTAVALLARPDEEVHRVGAQPAPSGPLITGAKPPSSLHLQQTRNADIHRRASFIAIAADPQGFRRRRWYRAMGIALLVVCPGSRGDTFRSRIYARFSGVAAEFPCPCNVAGEKPALRRRSLPAFTRLKDSAGIHGLRKAGRAQLPLFASARRFTRQVQAADGGIHLTIANLAVREPAQQGARAGSQMHRRYFSPSQQTAGGQRNVEGLRLSVRFCEIRA